MNRSVFKGSFSSLLFNTAGKLSADCASCCCGYRYCRHKPSKRLKDISINGNPSIRVQPLATERRTQPGVSKIFQSNGCRTGWHSTTKLKKFCWPHPAVQPLNDRVDAQVLLRQVRLELELWEQDQPLSQQPQWYTGKISEALTYVLVSEKLSPAEKHRAVITRLAGVDALCTLGIENLNNGNPGRTRDALKSLQRTIDFHENELLAQPDPWIQAGDVESLRMAVEQSILNMRELADHIRDKVLPVASVPDKFGPGVYTRKLAIFSDNSVTPENLSVIALQEIDRVRELMLELAGAWWDEKDRGRRNPRARPCSMLPWPPWKMTARTTSRIFCVCSGRRPKHR